MEFNKNYMLKLQEIFFYEKAFFIIIHELYFKAGFNISNIQGMRGKIIKYIIIQNCIKFLT